MVELIVNNEGIDLGRAKVEVSFQVNLIGSLETRQGDNSFQFELPGTQKNRRLLKRPEGVNADPYERIACTIKNGNELKRGFLQIEIFDGKIQANFFAGNTNWITLLGDRLISELDISDLDHAWTEANVVGSFANTEGYIYPYMNIDGNLDADLDDIAHTDLYPAVFISTILQRIFQGITHKISGDLLDTPDFKRLILPFVKTNFSNPTNYYESRSMFMGLAIAETNIDYSVHWSDDTPPFYRSDLYVQATGQYTANGDYTLDLDASVDITAAACFPLTVSIRKNAVDLVFQVLAAPGVATLNTSDQTTAGDIYDVYVLSGGVGCPAISGTASTMSFIAEQILNDGDEIQMSNTLAEMKQINLIKYIFVSFGIIPTYDEYSQTISFNMFKSLKQNEAEDWSAKYIPDYELDFFEFIGNYSKINYLRYEEAEDTNLEDYRSQNGQGYGDGLIEVNNDFITGIGDMFGTDFVPTWFEAVFDGVRTANISTYTRDDKPRILLCVPDTSVADFATFPTVNVGVTAVTEIAWAYFAKYRLGTGLDAITLNLSYDNPNILNVNGEGLSDKYWRDYEAILQEPIMLKAPFKLTSSDILNLDYTRPKYIEAENVTGYWFLNRIKGYDFSSKKVECELVKIATHPTSQIFGINPIGIESLEWWFNNSDLSTFNLTGPLVDSQTDSALNGYIRSTVGGERPTLAGIEVIFGGAQALDLNQLGTMLAFTKGELFIVSGGVVPASQHVMTSSDTASLDDRIQFLNRRGFVSENRSITILYIEGGVQSTFYGDDSLDNSDYHILNWRSNGTRYRMAIDGVEQTVNVGAGVDNGDWFGDNPLLDNFTFFALKATSTFYSTGRDKESIYFNEELSSANRAGIVSYLKIKHGI